MAPTPEMINLDEMVEDWAHEMFKATATKDQAKIAKDALSLTLNWKRAKFYHDEPVFNDQHSASKPNSQVLFKSDFLNNTESEQEYSFKTSRTTKSSCEVEYEQGYTIGQEVSFKLATPCEVFEANAGFHREITLNKQEGECVEEELTWEVDSQIRVPPRRRTEAKLVISEQQYGAKFTMNTTFKGTVVAVFTNLNDNNSFVKSLEGDLVEIFRHQISKFKLKTFNIADRAVKTTIKGKCEFRFGIEQHVQLTETPLALENGTALGR